MWIGSEARTGEWYGASGWNRTWAVHERATRPGRPSKTLGRAGQGNGYRRHSARGARQDANSMRRGREQTSQAPPPPPLPLVHSAEPKVTTMEPKPNTRSPYSSVVERQSCKLKVLGSVPSGGCVPWQQPRFWQRAQILLGGDIGAGGGRGALGSAARAFVVICLATQHPVGAVGSPRASQDHPAPPYGHEKFTSGRPWLRRAT